MDFGVFQLYILCKFWTWTVVGFVVDVMMLSSRAYIWC